MTIRKTPKTPVYKLEVYVTDFHHYGIDEVMCLLDDASDMVGITVVHTDTKHVEWHDDIDLNQSGQAEEAYRKLFEHK